MPKQGATWLYGYIAIYSYDGLWMIVGLSSQKQKTNHPNLFLTMKYRNAASLGGVPNDFFTIFRFVGPLAIVQELFFYRNNIKERPTTK